MYSNQGGVPNFRALASQPMVPRSNPNPTYSHSQAPSSSSTARHGQNSHQYTAMLENARQQHMYLQCLALQQQMFQNQMMPEQQILQEQQYMPQQQLIQEQQCMPQYMQEQQLIQEQQYMQEQQLIREQQYMQEQQLIQEQQYMQEQQLIQEQQYMQEQNMIQEQYLRGQQLQENQQYNHPSVIYGAAQDPESNYYQSIQLASMPQCRSGDFSYHHPHQQFHPVQYSDIPNLDRYAPPVSPDITINKKHAPEIQYLEAASSRTPSDDSSLDRGELENQGVLEPPPGSKLVSAVEQADFPRIINTSQEKLLEQRRKLDDFNRRQQFKVEKQKQMQKLHREQQIGQVPANNLETPPRNLCVTFHKICGIPKLYFNWDLYQYNLEVSSVTKLCAPGKSQTNVFPWSKKNETQYVQKLGPFTSTKGLKRESVDCELSNETFSFPLPSEFQNIQPQWNMKDVGFNIRVCEHDSIGSQGVGVAKIPLNHFFVHKSGEETGADLFGVNPSHVRCYDLINDRQSDTGEPIPKIYVSLRIRNSDGLEETGSQPNKTVTPLGLLQFERQRRQTKAKSNLLSIFCSAPK